MAAIDISKFELVKFDLTSALTGIVLFAHDTEENLYYRALNFQTGSGDLAFPYRALIEGNFVAFNAEGKSAAQKYTLYCVPNKENEIDDSTSIEGDDVTTVDPETGKPVKYNLSKMTYSENVALQILNALVERLPDPSSLSPVLMKLFAQKAFEFSNEFVSKAITFRKSSDKEDGDIGTEEPEETTGITFEVEEALQKLFSNIKVKWVTRYPSNPENGVFYVKLKSVEQQ